MEFDCEMVGLAPCLSFVALLVFSGAAFAASPAGLRWIAHRGGVVDARFSENSPASLEAAIAQAARRRE